MTSPSPLPRPVQPFVQFGQILRAHGFAIAPEQITEFVEAVGLLGPRDMSDIRNAALAMLAVPNERLAEFDALFRAFFLGQTVSASVTDGQDDEEVEAYEERDGTQEVDMAEEEPEVGEEASTVEALSRREFDPQLPEDVLRAFARQAPSVLPRRRSYRRMASRQGTAFDMRRSLREAVKRDGEVFELFQTRRKTRQRPITLLIDVSGSMQQQSQDIMRFAHTLKQTGQRVEVFTFGTRLTRITKALSDKNVDRALSRVGGLVSDFDGGTRIGDALHAMLAVPRFASTLRGACVVVISDGLERGEPDAMRDAVLKISRTAWRIDWLTPLAGDADFTPRTEALTAILPYLDSLSDGSSLSSIASHVLELAVDYSRRAA